MRDPLLHIIHIQEALEDILSFTHHGRTDFLADKKTQNAVVRSFEVIGEATKRLGREVTSGHPEVPWRTIAGFRDILIHAYDRVDLDEVWNVVEQNVPQLLDQVREIRRGLEQDR